MSTWKFSIWKTSISLRDNHPNTNKLSSLKTVNIYSNWGLGDRSIRERKKIVFFIYLLQPAARWYPLYRSNSWCELSMTDDGETSAVVRAVVVSLQIVIENIYHLCTEITRDRPRHVRQDIYILSKNFHHRGNFYKVVDEVREAEIRKRLKMFSCRKQKSEKSKTICCFIFS